MTKRVWALVLGIVLSAGWAFAADVDGRWTIDRARQMLLNMYAQPR